MEAALTQEGSLGISYSRFYKYSMLNKLFAGMTMTGAFTGKTACAFRWSSFRDPLFVIPADAGICAPVVASVGT